MLPFHPSSACFGNWVEGFYWNLERKLQVVSKILWGCKLASPIRTWFLRVQTNHAIVVNNSRVFRCFPNYANHVTSQSVRPKKKVKIRFFKFPRAPHLTPFPTTHFHSSPYLFDRLLTSPHFSFLSFSSFSFSSNTSLHSLKLSHWYLHTTISTIIFFGNVIGKSLRTHKHLHILFLS